jgi:hypothetical protein
MIMRFVVIIFLLMYFTGCDQNNQAESVAEPQATVRQTIEKRNADTEWTLDFSEGNAARAAGRSIPLSPENIAAASAKMTGNNIYPELPGFGSLNISNLNTEQRSIINRFCNAIIAANTQNASAVFKASTRFLLVILFEDIKTTKFDRFLIGAPMIIDSTWQIPVRFFSGGSHLDMQVYLIYEAGWFIDQIAYGDITGG